MATTELSGTRVPAASNTLTVDRLLSAPLADLLAAVNAEIVDAAITDATLLGYVVQRHDGFAQLRMPAGRSELERDAAARMLVGKLLGAPMRPVPPSIETRTYGGAR